TGAPLATVKSRLRRGLQLLRERLDRERGDWRAALCAATGLPFSSAAATLTLTALLMANSTKILFGAAAAAVAAFLLLDLGDPEAPPIARAGSAAPAPAGADAATDTGSAPTERELATGPGPTTGIDLDHPFAYDLRCLVVDLDGLLVPHAQVAVGLPGARLSRELQPTGDDGEVTVSWRARKPTMTVQVGLIVSGQTESLREVRVHASADNRLALLYASGGGQRPCAAGRRQSKQSCNACHQAADANGGLFPAPLRLEGGLHPFARLRDALVGDTGARPQGFAPPPPAPPPFDDFAPEEMEVPAEETTVRGVVRGANGAPVAHATVAWCRRPDLAGFSTRTDA
ncbi:MAG: hypothetical protein KAI24_11230, partial [Planctomycetes bacterium]|nr:hypothetical protein [Planctomycetota bacterium]